jgi:hypothetical protein
MGCGKSKVKNRTYDDVEYYQQQQQYPQYYYGDGDDESNTSPSGSNASPSAGQDDAQSDVSDEELGIHRAPRVTRKEARDAKRRAWSNWGSQDDGMRSTSSASTAEEPSATAKSISWAWRTVKARMFHDINGDIHQFTPDDEDDGEDDLRHTAAVRRRKERIQCWIDEVLAYLLDGEAGAEAAAATAAAGGGDSPRRKGSYTQPSSEDARAPMLRVSFGAMKLTRPATDPLTGLAWAR